MRNKFPNIIRLPGLIDVHVHLREPGGTQKEDFETGTKAAIAGGYTQILDMPNNVPPTVSLSSLKNKMKRARTRIYCDVGFNFGATAQSTREFSKVTNQAFGLKIYMSQTTGPLLVTANKEHEKIFKLWQSPLPIMVHAQGDLVERAIYLANKYNRKIHICHITSDQLHLIKKVKKTSLEISCEVCPHHLFLNKGDVKKLGPLGIMKPPLMTKNQQEKIWDNLDLIDIIASDHAPHTLEEKFDQSESKFGVPGLETTLPLMLTAVAKKLLTIEKLILMTHTVPKKIFKLPNQPNTYVEIATDKQYKISNTTLFTKCGWSPFQGLVVNAKIIKTVIGGKIVFTNGKFVGKPQGKVIVPVS